MDGWWLVLQAPRHAICQGEGGAWAEKAEWSGNNFNHEQSLRQLGAAAYTADLTMCAFRGSPSLAMPRERSGTTCTARGSDTANSTCFVDARLATQACSDVCGSEVVKEWLQYETLVNQK